jgi:hypothetical protein
MRNRRTSTQSRKGTDMTAIALTESSLLNAKRALSAGLPTEKSSHLTEALAAACGYQTHAALLAALRGGNEADPDFVLLDDASFVRRLSQLTGGADVRKNGFAGFERLEYPSRHEIVRTQSKRWKGIRFKSTRGRAWRNAMVAAINAGISQRLFSVRPGDNRWPGASETSDHKPREPHAYRFMIGDIPAVASVSDAGWDELSIHVALWPTARGDYWIVALNAGFLASEADVLVPQVPAPHCGRPLYRTSGLRRPRRL